MGDVSRQEAHPATFPAQISEESFHALAAELAEFPADGLLQQIQTAQAVDAVTHVPQPALVLAWRNELVAVGVGVIVEHVVVIVLSPARYPWSSSFLTSMRATVDSP